MARLMAVLAIVLLPKCAWPQTDSNAPSGPRRSHDHFRLDGYLMTNGYYDDNVFNYSSTERAIIGTQADTSARFPIESVDDYVMEVFVRSDAIVAVGRRTSWRIRLRYDADLYVRNTSRSHQQLGAELRWEHRRTYAEASLRWLPSYYLREMYWRPMPSRPPGVRYAAAEFAKYSFALEAGTRLRRGLDGLVSVAFDRRDYKAPFDERDNDAFTVGAGLSWKVEPHIQTQMRVHFGNVHAAGADSPDSLVADVSNRQAGAEAGLEIKLDGRGKLRLAETVAYEHQTYTTDNSIDRFHYHRKDDEYGWDSQLTWLVHPHWQPRLFYTFRKSTTTEALSTDEGAFTGNRVGVQLIYYF